MYRLVIEPLQKQQETIHLTSEQLHYLKRVLRMEKSDCFVVMDGVGKSWLVELQESTAIILEFLTDSKELPVLIDLIVALPKGNGFEDIVRCGTEIGVNRIIPVISLRTIIKPSANKWERWCKIAREAAEQSERQIVPQISPVLTLTQALANSIDTDTAAFFCVTRTNSPHLSSFLSNTGASKIIIATGPEGGWAPEEIQLALDCGFMGVSLGKRILRAVTAPIVALALVAAAKEVD